MSSALLVEPLLGAQVPRVLSLPPGLPDQPDDFGDRAVRLAELAGLFLDPWQQFALRAMLRRSEHHWAAFESVLLVPRQNGKSVVLEAFDLAKLFLSPPGHLILHTAHLFPTAMESYRHLTGLVRNTPELWAEVARVSKAHGEEGLELHNGSRLRFAARTVTGAGRGFSPDDVVLDEAFKLPHEALSAMMPALSAKPNPQIVYASSTGYPDSEILWSLVERGRKGGDESLAYLEWSADSALDLTDADDLWLAVMQANPALGYRLTERKIAAEMSSMRPEDRDRERLGLWADTTFQGVVSLTKWAALEDPESTATPLAFGIEIDEDRTLTTIGMAGVRTDERMHLELFDQLPGTDGLLARCKQLDAATPGVVFAIDEAGAAASEADDLEKAGLRVVLLRSSQIATACAGMVDAVNQGTVAHGPQDELVSAIAGARKKQWRDGAFSFGRRVSTVDIGPLVAVTLARHVALTLAPLTHVTVAFL